MKYLFILFFLFSTSASAIVEDIFNISLSLIDRSNNIERQEKSNLDKIRHSLLVKKTCEATVLLTRKKLEIRASQLMPKLQTTQNKAKFLNIYLKAQNNLYKKLILCNNTAIIGIKNQL